MHSPAHTTAAVVLATGRHSATHTTHLLVGLSHALRGEDTGHAAAVGGHDGVHLCQLDGQAHARDDIVVVVGCRGGASGGAGRAGGGEVTAAAGARRCDSRCKAVEQHMAAAAAAAAARTLLLLVCLIASARADSREHTAYESAAPSPPIILSTTTGAAMPPNSTMAATDTAYSANEARIDLSVRGKKGVPEAYWTCTAAGGEGWRGGRDGQGGGRPGVERGRQQLMGRPVCSSMQAACTDSIGHLSHHPAPHQPTRNTQPPTCSLALLASSARAAVSTPTMPPQWEATMGSTSASWVGRPRLEIKS